MDLRGSVNLGGSENVEKGGMARKGSGDFLADQGQLSSKASL